MSAGVKSCEGEIRRKFSIIFVIRNRLQYLLPAQNVQVWTLTKGLNNTSSVKLVINWWRGLNVYKGRHKTCIYFLHHSLCTFMLLDPLFPIPRAFHYSCILPFTNCPSSLAFGICNRSSESCLFAVALWCMQKRKNRIRAMLVFAFSLERDLNLGLQDEQALSFFIFTIHNMFQNLLWLKAHYLKPVVEFVLLLIRKNPPHCAHMGLKEHKT